MKINPSQILILTAVIVPVLGAAIIGIALLCFKKKGPQRPAPHAEPDAKPDAKPHDKKP